MSDILNKIDINKCKNYRKDSVNNSCDLGDDTFCDGLCHYGAVELFKQLQYSEARVQELEEENKLLKDRLIISNAEHTDYITETNEKLAKLREKLKIAEEHLDVIARGYHFGDDIEKHLKLLTEQALQKMKEVDNG